MNSTGFDIADTTTTQRFIDAGLTGGSKALVSRLWSDGATSSDRYAVITVGNGNIDTTGREYHLAFDIFSTAYSKGATESKLWIMNGWDVKEELSSDVGIRELRTEFKNVTYDGSFNSSSGIKIQLWISASDPATTVATAFDNLVCMPYYKITYTGADEPVVQYLLDEEKNVATSYPIKTDNYPSADGKICIGWSTEENATEAMTSVALENADITLYPVWKEASKAPTMLKRNQIKDTGAMRFISIIDLDVAYDENTEEYGFLAALESTLAGTELTLDSTVAKVQGVAYNKEKGINIYYTRSATSDIQEVVNGTNQAVTAVVTGIPTSGYSQNLVVRPYITISGVTYYGEAFANNYAAVAGNSQEG